MHDGIRATELQQRTFSNIPTTILLHTNAQCQLEYSSLLPPSSAWRRRRVVAELCLSRGWRVGTKSEPSFHRRRHRLSPLLFRPTTPRWGKAVCGATDLSRRKLLEKIVKSKRAGSTAAEQIIKKSTGGSASNKRAEHTAQACSRPAALLSSEPESCAWMAEALTEDDDILLDQPLESVREAPASLPQPVGTTETECCGYPGRNVCVSVRGHDALCCQEEASLL